MKRLRLVVGIVVFLASGLRPLAQSAIRHVSESATAQADDRVRALMRELNSTDKYDRELAAERLAGLGHAAKPAMPALKRALRDVDDDVCIWAVRALCAIGPDAAPVVPALMSMSTAGVNTDKQCWGVPEIEIEQIGEPAVPYAVAALGTADHESALDLLLALGPLSVPDLSRAIDAGGKRAIAVADVFARMGIVREPAAVAAVPVLRRAYERKRINFATFASAVGAIGPAARDAAPDVVAGLRSREQAVRLDAIRALEAIGSASPVVVPALAEASSDPDAAVREAAAAALRRVRDGQRQ